MPPDHRLTELLDDLANLTTESRADRPDLASMPTSELVAQMIADSALVPAAIAQVEASVVAAVDAISERMARGGRLIYLGAGTAGRMGVLDASEIPPTFGTDPALVQAVIAGGSAAIHKAIENAEDDPTSAPQRLVELGIGAADTVVGISASGRSPFVVTGLRSAGAAGALTVALAANRDSQIGAAAHIPIEVITGPEFIAGSTRLKAGTTQKLVLNLLSTLTMVRLGKTYAGVMVDLQATNEKLRARSIRTVADITGVPVDQAGRALADSDGSVKRAILCLLAEIDDDRAQSLLLETGGHLGPAITAATRG